MSSKNKKKDKPRKPKMNPQANILKPRPLVLRSPKYYVEHARDYPIMGCWVRKDWKEGGLTPTVIARQQADDKVIFAVFLVDYYCLGVKDAMFNGDFPLKRFQNNLASLCAGEPEACDVDLAHELVYGSIKFARKYGFEPHPDYKMASLVLDPEGTHLAHHNLEFGKDGKPFYISGPYDNSQSIMAKLERTAGEGNYDFLTMIGEPEGFEDIGDEDDLDFFNSPDIIDLPPSDSTDE
jgi:hypothetical protein